MSTTPAPEISFYTDDLGVRVTSTRLIVGTTTFAMRNITSVSRAVEEPNRTGPIILGGLGIGGFVAAASEVGIAYAVVGGLALGLAVLWWVLQKTYYGVRVSSSSGESRPIISTDGSRIDTIIQAINEAIINRG